MQKNLKRPKIPYNPEWEEPVKAKKVPKEILDQYKEADKTIVFNEHDKQLHPIYVDLPEPPPVETIDNYGLPAKKQFFRRVEYPERLKRLERECQTIDEIHKRLAVDREDYQEEIDFIKREWHRRIHGYWVFINGTPTFIDGWHYFYLNYWKLDIGLPQYRSRDRKFFLFARFCYSDTFSFFPYRVNFFGEFHHFNDKNQAIKFISTKKSGILEEDGYYIDMKRRVCYGFNYPKHRREGATYKSECINYCIVSSLSDVRGGIQSMDGPSAEKAFKEKLIFPWQKVPFFFKPIYDGSTQPKTELVFDVPSVRIGGKGSLLNIQTGLQSVIDWANSAGRGWYDGDKLIFLHNDEVGKTIVENVDERWNVQKKCLAQGNGRWIHGLTLHTSTVGEMEKKGGVAFFNQCKKSHYQKRNPNGQTYSGLYNLFIPADDGLEGFIDIFGNSVIEDPTEEDLWRIPDPSYDANGKLQGARRFLNNNREELLLSDDPDSVTHYEEECRTFPLEFSECFITAGSGTGLNLKIITKRIREIQFDDTLTVRGNFVKVNPNETHSDVKWVPDPVRGKFVVSHLLSPQEANKRFTMKMTVDGQVKDVFCPINANKFTASGDPYSFRKTESGRMSYGGGAVWWNHDPMIDPPTKHIDEWITNRTICTYKFRPLSPDDYAEDMLLMCIYYGAMMYPEINVPLIWDHFIRRGYYGYLKFERLPLGGYKKTPGFYAKGANQQKLFQKHQEFIETHGMREQHIEILEEQKSIKSLDDLKNHDLFVAVGGAMLGAESDYGRKIVMLNDDSAEDISDFVQPRYYD